MTILQIGESVSITSHQNESSMFDIRALEDFGSQTVADLNNLSLIHDSDVYAYVIG